MTITGTVSNTITALGNIIGFNGGPGISITGSSSTGNTVIANMIGFNPVVPQTAGKPPVSQSAGNLGDGIRLDDGANGNFIGTGAIQAAFAYTPSITGLAVNTLRLNTPLPRSTFVAPPSSYPPISVVANVLVTVNGTLGNDISANGADGVRILGVTGNVDANTIVANTIGGGAAVPNMVSGVAAPTGMVGNLGDGIEIDDSRGNTIGGAVTPNSSTGAVWALGPDANYIVGNTGDGIYDSISATSGGINTITGTISGNLISGNSSNGVHVLGDLTGEASLPKINDNFVGTNVTGTSVYDSQGNRLGNGQSGILLEEFLGPNTVGAHGVTVTGNVISGNGLSGVTVESRDPTDNREANVLITGGNIIGLDLTGQTANISLADGSVRPLGNALDGVLIDNVLGVTVGSTLKKVTRN